MTNRNTAAIIEACDMLGHRTVEIGGARHGGAWLFDKVMRAFDFPATESVTYEVYFNAPVMKPGTVTIHRDGRMECEVKEEDA